MKYLKSFESEVSSGNATGKAGVASLPFNQGFYQSGGNNGAPGIEFTPNSIPTFKTYKSMKHSKKELKKKLKKIKFFKDHTNEAYGKFKDEKCVYWIVPTDNRLEDSLVKIYKDYSGIEDIIELIDSSLEIANKIREKNIKDKFVYISMNFCVDEDDEVVGKPWFDFFETSKRSEMDKKPLHYYVGNINVEEHELDADKYNL